MNMTLDNTVKTYAKSRTRETLGRILLKGDGISLIEEENDTVLEKYKKEVGKEKEKNVKWKTIGIRRDGNEGKDVIEENIVDTRFEDAEEDEDNTVTSVRKRMRQEGEEKE